MAQAYRAPSTTTHIDHTLGSLLWQFWLTHGSLCSVSACVHTYETMFTQTACFGESLIPIARTFCKFLHASIEIVRDFPRAAKQAQIELYLDEQSVIMI